MLPDLGARAIQHASAKQNGNGIEIHDWRVADQIIGGTLDDVDKLLRSLRRCVVS
jgi:hypothetical protein